MAVLPYQLLNISTYQLLVFHLRINIQLPFLKLHRTNLFRILLYYLLRPCVALQIKQLCEMGFIEQGWNAQRAGIGAGYYRFMAFLPFVYEVEQ